MSLSSSSHCVQDFCSSENLSNTVIFWSGQDSLIVLWMQTVQCNPVVLLPILCHKLSSTIITQTSQNIHSSPSSVFMTSLHGTPRLQQIRPDKTRQRGKWVAKALWPEDWLCAMERPSEIDQTKITTLSHCICIYHSRSATVVLSAGEKTRLVPVLRLRVSLLLPLDIVRALCLTVSQQFHRHCVQGEDS